MKAALITGAGGGIGADIARGLAAEGYNLFLVGRNAERLSEIAEELRQTQKVTVHTHVEDLSVAGAASRVMAKVACTRLDVSVLVNNAGIGLHGRLVDHSNAAENEMVGLNVVALHQLTHAVLPLLVRRGGGRILNVSSTAGFQPLPYMATYAATKAFVLSFSQALSDELRDTGVTVTALCPGPTATRFASAAGALDTKLFARTASAKHVACVGIAAMHRGQPVAIAGLKNRLLTWAGRFLPRMILVRFARTLTAPRGLLPAKSS